MSRPAPTEPRPASPPPPWAPGGARGPAWAAATGREDGVAAAADAEGARAAYAGGAGLERRVRRWRELRVAEYAEQLALVEALRTEVPWGR